MTWYCVTIGTAKWQSPRGEPIDSHSKVSGYFQSAHAQREGLFHSSAVMVTWLLWWWEQYCLVANKRSFWGVSEEQFYFFFFHSLWPASVEVDFYRWLLRGKVNLLPLRLPACLADSYDPRCCFVDGMASGAVCMPTHNLVRAPTFPSQLIL